MKLEDDLSKISTVCDIIQSAPVNMDLITSLCGEAIGFGSTRDVFVYNLDPKYVIKLEPRNTSCNLVEYMMWDEIRWLTGDLEWVKKWFAPVKWISPNGRVLVMKRTSDKNLEPPEKIPKFLWDVKLDNFGWIGKNFVCHDYGQFYNFIHYPKGKQKANWFKQ